MFERIEDYFIAMVSNLKNKEYGEGNYTQERVQEFVCVKNKGTYYKDLMTNEKYNFGSDIEYDIHNKFIDPDYSLIPLSEFINVSDSEMLKENLIKVVNVVLNELNEKLINNKEEISKKMI